MLEEARAEGVRHWWCLGDLVGYGADPGAVLDRTLLEASRVIAGNHDLGVAGRIPLDDFASWAGVALRWTRRAIGEAGCARLAALEPFDTGPPVPLFHASPRDPVWEYVVSVEQAEECLRLTPDRLTLIGHTHVPAAWCLRPGGGMAEVEPVDGAVLDYGGGRWLVNPGSTGQPRDHDARAAWALLEPDAHRLTFRRTRYDVVGAQRAILAAGLPQMLAARLAEGR